MYIKRLGIHLSPYFGFEKGYDKLWNVWTCQIGFLRLEYWHNCKEN